MQVKPYRIAVITVDSVKRRSFGWLATGGKPFVQLDPADIDDKKHVAGFLLCREHKNGIKLGLTAAADSKEAKKAVVELNRKAFNVAGVFGEVSPPLEKVLRGHVPELNASDAAKVLQPLKKINRVAKDRKHYWRDIKNIGEKRKMMVGRPV